MDEKEIRELPKRPERGEPDRYEVTWMTGHIETILAHQITWPQNGLAMASLFSDTKVDAGPPWIRMHAEVEGRWCLTLQARETDIRSVRLVTEAEQIPGAES